MPVFVYKAADQRGKTIAGVMEAPDSRAVVERLHREEYYPIEVAPQTESPGLWSRLGARGISNRDLVALTQQLATLFEAGLPLDRSLTVLEELASTPRIRVIVGDLLQSVRGGASFGDALAKHHPRPFSTSIWCGPERRAACWRQRSAASPNSWRRRRSSERRSCRPSSTPRS